MIHQIFRVLLKALHVLCVLLISISYIYFLDPQNPRVERSQRLALQLGGQVHTMQSPHLTKDEWNVIGKVRPRQC